MELEKFNIANFHHLKHSLTVDDEGTVHHAKFFNYVDL